MSNTAESAFQSLYDEQNMDAYSSMLGAMLSKLKKDVEDTEYNDSEFLRTHDDLVKMQKEMERLYDKLTNNKGAQS